MAFISFLLLFLPGLHGWFPPAADLHFHAAGISEAYLAKDSGDGTAGPAANEFNTDDIPIHCVVLLDSDEVVTVKMELVAVDVRGVNAESKILNVGYTTKRGETRVNFTGRPEGKWTPGKYRVDLYLNGAQVEDLPFTINGNMRGSGNTAMPSGPVKRTRRP